MSETKISIEVFNKLPTGAKIIKAEKIRDMGGSLVDAILVTWYDKEYREGRKAHFSIETGDYLGDTFWVTKGF